MTDISPQPLTRLPQFFHALIVSAAGLTDRVTVERKALADLVACLGRERERFERELQRGVALDAFTVVVEASRQDVAAGNYRSRMNLHAACQSVLAFAGRYCVPFLYIH